jgi:hypothetical protein
MALTKNQVKIVDALENGGHIWKAGSSYYLARVTGHMANGTPRYESETINARTFKALEPLLHKFLAKDRWVLK